MPHRRSLNGGLCLNHSMFARKVRVQYQQGGQLQLCPLKWLDNFSMRNFTNASVFDDTLPVADGYLEIGSHVPLDQLGEAMEDWFRRKSYLPKDATLVLTPT
jgi:hypothetical protein